MRTLFFRIFIWFWMAVVVLAVTFAGIIVLTRFGMPRERLHAFRRAVAISARASATSYEQQGGQGLRNVLNVRGGSVNDVYFFNQQLREVQGLGAPSEAQTLASMLLSQSSQKCLNRQAWIACSAVGPSGRPYALVMRFRPGLLVSPTEWAVLLPALMSVAGLVCFWLARYLTQPISRLRQLTGRFAAGDLKARVGDYSAYSHSEELQGLARDFDHMAEQLHGFMERQKHLLWDISHELRTPLTRIGLAIGLTRQRLLGPLPKEFGRIDRELERLNQLIGQILTIAQLEAGSRQQDRRSIDLPELVDEIVRDAALEADARNVTIRVERCGVAYVLGSRELLRAAFENILRNAIRHTVRSSTVTVQLLQAAGKASVAICDQGPGVAESDLQRLFDPFFRTADARLNHPDGTGLGLATTRRIVEWHGGSVVACNHAGQGLVVTTLLPLPEASTRQNWDGVARATQTASLSDLLTVRKSEHPVSSASSEPAIPVVHLPSAFHRRSHLEFPKKIVLPSFGTTTERN